MPHWSLLGIPEWGHTQEAHSHQGTDKVILKFLACLVGHFILSFFLGNDKQRHSQRVAGKKEEGEETGSFVLKDRPQVRFYWDEMW